VDRRGFLKAAATTAGTAGALALLPPSLREAWAAPAPAGGWENIEHVVIFMQENRSFDHYYGTMANVRGYADLNALQLSSGRSVFHQPGDGGVILPFATSIQTITGCPHDAGTGHDAYAEGRYDGWIGAKSDQTMVRYDDASMAFYHQLAQAFTTCDNYHCSVNGPTDPNRSYLFSGKSDDPMMLDNNVSLVQSIFHSPIVLNALQTIPLTVILEVVMLIVRGLTNLIPARAPEVAEDVIQALTGLVVAHWTFVYTWPELQGPDGVDTLVKASQGLTWSTYAERLQQHGTSWKVYQEWDNYGDNSLEYFVSFRDLGRTALKYTDSGGGVPFADFPGYYAALAKDPSQQGAFDKALQRGLNELPAADQQLVHRGLLRTGAGNLVASLKDDISAGTLPKVSWIVAPEPLCEHPSWGPRNGQALTHDILAALSEDPKVWDKTVFILNYDENDGYFDHIPGPVPPPDEPGEWVNGYNIGLGSRIPTLVVSPWTKQAVCSELFDHTSVLKFLERVTGVAEPNISGWRRKMCGDLSSLFDFSGSAPLTVPPAQPHADVDGNAKLEPVPSDQRIPAQSPGRTTRIPLPSRQGARIQQHPDAKSITITIDNRGHGTTYYRIHPNAFVTNFTPDRFDVDPGGNATKDYPADGRYDYTVYGTDGFQRRFTGDLTQPGGSLEVTVTEATDSHKITYEFINSGKDKVTFTVKPNAYRNDGPWTIPVAAGKTVSHEMVLDAEAEGSGWYDLTATVDTDPGFLRRFRGYAETGARGVTANDPAPFNRLLLDRSMYETDRDIVVSYAVSGNVTKHKLAVFADPGSGIVDPATAAPVRTLELSGGDTRDEVMFPVSKSGKLQPGPLLPTGSSNAPSGQPPLVTGSASGSGGVPALPSGSSLGLDTGSSGFKPGAPSSGSSSGSADNLPTGSAGDGLAAGVYILHHLDDANKPLAQPVRFRIG